MTSSGRCWCVRVTTSTRRRRHCLDLKIMAKEGFAVERGLGFSNGKVKYRKWLYFQVGCYSVKCITLHLAFTLLYVDTARLAQSTESGRTTKRFFMKFGHYFYLPRFKVCFTCSTNRFRIAFGFNDLFSWLSHAVK